MRLKRPSEEHTGLKSKKDPTFALFYLQLSFLLTSFWGELLYGAHQAGHARRVLRRFFKNWCFFEGVLVRHLVRVSIGTEVLRRGGS